MLPDAPFSKPWEAQAFALAVELSDQGVFEWREFSAVLSAEIKAAEARQTEDGYYSLWLAALEKLLAGKRVISAVVLEAREAKVKQASVTPAHPPASPSARP